MTKSNALIVLFSALLSISLIACSSKQKTTNDQPAESTTEVTTEETPPVESTTTEDEPSPLFASAEWPDNEVTDGVPKPEFSVTPDSVDTQDSDRTPSVTGEWTNVPDQEVADYVQQLKDAGFVVNSNENRGATSYGYSASNKDITPYEDIKTISIHYNIIKSTDENAEPIKTLNINITLMKAYA